MEAEALRKFPKTNLFDDVAPVLRLHSLLGHEGPEQRVQADHARLLFRKVERDVVKSRVIDWTGLAIFVGELAGQ